MKVFKIVNTPTRGGIIFGGDEAYVDSWPRNPEGQDLTLMFTLECTVLKEKLQRNDLPSHGVLHVFSTYDPEEYFLDLITYDQVSQKKDSPSYTFAVHSNSQKICKSPCASIPLQYADLVEETIGDEEISVASLFADYAPRGAMVPENIECHYNFLCQIYSSDFPSPYENAFYLTGGVGYLLINKNLGDEKADGCFFVQVA